MSSPLRYPTDQVVGIVPDRADTDGVIEALRDAGIDAARVHVLRGPTDDLAPDPDEADGPLRSVIQTVQKALGDEAARLEQLEEALERGHDVVAVEVAGGDDDEDEDASKGRIAEALHGCGVRDVAFYGEYQIQQLSAGGTT